MSDTFAMIEQVGPRGMMTLRGDLSSTKLKNAATGVAGVDFPGISECNCVDERGIAWMSPDEVLVITPYDEIAKDLKRMQKILSGTHHLLANVSDARSVFMISGAKSREIIAKLSPVDLHPDSLIPGQFRRTRLAQVPAAFWMRDKNTFELICFRSVADYVSTLLHNAASAGSEVGYFQ
ncbi:sarcosine oxidase subunit gamma [Parasulfitobacter algicola]|uniref:Sarcosine oxidase subunit gamma n=1 Tax=Parasulfitobacter algicola TaxID=2614809 RepID=A0ABX2IYI7_9RHOB|nr:sarcosine oxidase subunit gamma family protein [Sulfitobacter algicola]NSX56365.1 sarcosine oxidase subunit gamma [Sulfitobacter algicola]